MRVVTGRDDDQIRLECPRQGDDDTFRQADELRAPGARANGKVDRRPLPRSGADLRGRAGPRIERTLVDAHVDDVARDRRRSRRSRCRGGRPSRRSGPVRRRTRRSREPRRRRRD